MKLRAIRNHIIFEFLDGVDHKGQFTETVGGIKLLGHFDNSAKTARWASVLYTGPDVDRELCQEGCEILIDSLRWTEGVEFEGKKYWRTDDKQVLAYRFNK